MEQAGLETVLTLQNSARENAKAFGRDKSIRMVLTIRNRTSDTLKLSLPSACTHDMVVTTKQHKELWRWSTGRMFAQVLTDVTLLPGESKSFVEIWDQTGSDGRPVPPGEYEAVGLIPARNEDIRSKPQVFTIR